MKIAIGEITDRGIKAVIRRRGGKLKTFLASKERAVYGKHGMRDASACMLCKNPQQTA